MKVIQVFIFCLLLSCWFLPTAIFAVEKSVIVYLAIAPRDLLAEAIEMINKEEFIEPIVEPIILDKTNIDGVEVVLTFSGSTQTEVILSVF